MVLQPLEDDVDLSPVLERVACHMMVEAIPDRGIPELWHTLVGIREFHSEPVPKRAELPAPERLSVRIGHTYERPPFRLEEE